MVMCCISRTRISRFAIYSLALLCIVHCVLCIVVHVPRSGGEGPEPRGLTEKKSAAATAAASPYVPGSVG